MTSNPPTPDATIWMNGKLVPWAQANIHVLAHSLHYGSGVFEGIRAYASDQGAAIFRLTEHIERLFESAQCISMTLPYSIEEINAACVAVVRDNQLSSAYIRPISFYGAENMGLHAPGLSVNVAIAAWTWGAYLGPTGAEQGIRVHASSIVRSGNNFPISSSKVCGNYIYSMVATKEALDAGCDEALLLEQDGTVSEGSGENLFLVQDGKLVTPRLGSALDGITRRTIIKVARDLGLSVHETPLKLEDVLQSDEAFFTGTAAEITPIRELDGQAIGNGSRGAVTEQLQTLYLDTVHGRIDAYRHWLTSAH